MNKTPKEKPCRLYVRVSPSEKKKITEIAKCCGVPVAEYLRKRALGYAVKAAVHDAFYDFNESLSELLNRELSPDVEAAAIVLVDSNLHREHILPSEKAFAYKMKAEALEHKGFRTDLTSVQLAPRLATEQIAEDVGTSKDTIKRYIRLTNLIPEILKYVDEGRISFTPAVELSYLNEQEQQDLLEQIEQSDCTPSLSQACRFKKISQGEGLTPEVIAKIMEEEKANQREMFKVPMERIRHYVPNANAKQAEDFVLKACEHYRKFLIRQRNRDER